MKSRIATILILTILAALIFNAGYLFGQSPWAPISTFAGSNVSKETETAFAPMWEVLALVQSRYYTQPLDNDQLAEGAINGMITALDDPYSRYLSPQDEAAERDSMAGELQGIGVEVTSENDLITVISPIDGSPAEAAGLLPGDVLLEADGIDLTGMNTLEAAMVVRGPAGTAVSLVILRDGETIDFEVIRDIIKISSVRGEMLADNIAYVRLSQFGNDTAVELQKLLDELNVQEPAGLIVDVRRNPGGSLDTVVDIADEFLPAGIVLRQQFGDGQERQFKSTKNGLAEEIPLVILIDEGSASASEVLAGAIQDRERGILIGQPSFGKGTVQTWHQLSNDGGLRITIARWLTPNELWVQGDGLQPDISIALPEIETLDEFEDLQLQAAIDYLLGKELISTLSNEG